MEGGGLFVKRRLEGGDSFQGEVYSKGGLYRVFMVLVQMCLKSCD